MAPVELAAVLDLESEPESVPVAAVVALVVVVVTLA